MAWAVNLPLDSSKIRLSASYIRDNNLAIQTVISASNLNNGTAYIPVTHPVFFYSDTAPTGWTLFDTPKDCLLALQTDTGSPSSLNYVNAGGTVKGTWDGPSYVLDLTQIPSHTHKIDINMSSSIGFDTGSGNFAHPVSNNAQSGSSGGGLGHQHDWSSTRPYAAVGVLCTKNV